MFQRTIFKFFCDNDKYVQLWFPYITSETLKINYLVLGCIPPYCSLCNYPALKLQKNSESETETSIICWTGSLTSQRQRPGSDTLPCMAKGRQDSTASFATQERKRLPITGWMTSEGLPGYQGNCGRNAFPICLQDSNHPGDWHCWFPNNGALNLRIRTILSWRLRDHAGSYW